MELAIKLVANALAELGEILKRNKNSYSANNNGD